MVRSRKTKRSWDKKTKTVKSAPPVLLTLLPSPTTPPSTSTTTGSKYRRQPLIQEIQLPTTRKYSCLYTEYTIAQKQDIELPMNYTSFKTGDGLLLYRKYRWQPLIQEIQLTNRICNFSYEMEIQLTNRIYNFSNEMQLLKTGNKDDLLTSRIY